MSESASARPSGAVIGSALVAALGGLLFGFDTAVISGAEQALQSQFALSDQWLGFTVAVALVGTIVGSAAAGRPADRYGRRPVLYVLAAMYLVSSIACGLAPDWYSFIIARFVGGMAIGGSSVVAPMYIAEIAPGRWRGRLVALNQLNVVGGILLSFVSNYFIADLFDMNVAWRWMVGAVAVPSALFLVLLNFVPESPRWLAKRGRVDEARGVLARLRVHDADGEMAAIRRSLDGEKLGDASLFRRQYRRAVFLAFAIAAFNQLTGINALMYYAKRIFEMAGASPESALLQPVYVGGTNFLFTALALLMIDRFGRRPLLAVGSVGTAISLGVVAYQFGLGAAADGRVILGALLVYIAFFAFSSGAVIWVFISEIFPTAVRAKGQALGSFTHWTMAAAVSWTFPVFAKSSPAGVFWFFAGCMALQFAFAVFLMPETKGGRLEDVGERVNS